MKKKFNVRDLIIVMLCITIICMAVGFCYVSILLDKKNNEKTTFDVSIIKVDKKTPIKGGISNPVGSNLIMNDGKSVDFNFTLNVPGDELAYTVTLKNNGTLPAKIIDLVEYPNCSNDGEDIELIKPITITKTDVKGKVLKPEEKMDVTIVVKYGKTNMIMQKTLSYMFTVVATTN